MISKKFDSNILSEHSHIFKPGILLETQRAAEISMIRTD